MKENASSPWNSLEVSKIIVGFLTPLTIFVLGVEITSSERARSENSASFSRVAEHRTKLWDALGADLNDIYAYTMYVGYWKNWTASDIVSAKRRADKTFYANRPFFSDEFAQDYERFMAASFQTYNSMGEDAKPRTTSDFRSPKDENVVSGRQNFDQIHTAYYQLLNNVAEEFDLRVTKPTRARTPVESLEDFATRRK